MHPSAQAAEWAGTEMRWDSLRCQQWPCRLAASASQPEWPNSPGTFCSQPGAFLFRAWPDLPSNDTFLTPSRRGADLPDLGGPGFSFLRHDGGESRTLPRIS